MPSAFNVLWCYEHTQQNVHVGVHGAQCARTHTHTHTRRGMHTQPHIHQHLNFCVVILLGNANNYNTRQKKYNTLDNIYKIPLITPGSPVKI